MDGGGGEFLAAISTWFTPTVFFCLLNVVVATIFIRSTFKQPNNNNNNQEHQNDPVQFFRSPSLLQRVKSINFSRNYHSVAEPAEVTQHAEPEKEPATEDGGKEEEEEIHVARTVSDTTVVKRGVKKMMKKSQSLKIVRVEEVEEEKVVERQRPATVRERNGTAAFSEDEAVDAKADDFINRFKQQLKLQRIESLLKYRGGAEN